MDVVSDEAKLLTSRRAAPAFLKRRRPQSCIGFFMDDGGVIQGLSGIYDYMMQCVSCGRPRGF